MGAARVILGGSLTLALVACGSGTSGSAKSDYLAKADAICVGVRHQLDTLPAPAADATLADIATYLDHSVKFNSDAFTKVRALTPPVDDKATVARILDEFDSAISKARIAQQKAAAGDATGADLAVKEIDIALQKASSDAKQYGFTSCGQHAPAGASAGP